MNVDKVLQTLLMVGADFPAYKALFDEVMLLFSDADQQTLKDAYTQAMATSDAAHKAAQQP